MFSGATASWSDYAVTLELEVLFCKGDPFKESSILICSLEEPG